MGCHSNKNIFIDSEVQKSTFRFFVLTMDAVGVFGHCVELGKERLLENIQGNY